MATTLVGSLGALGSLTGAYYDSIQQRIYLPRGESISNAQAAATGYQDSYLQNAWLKLAKLGSTNGGNVTITGATQTTGFTGIRYEASGKDDPESWLRRRVKEICWVPA